MMQRIIGKRKNVSLALAFAVAAALALGFAPGCGKGGEPSITQITRITGMVAVPASGAALARLGLKPAAREAAQTATACGVIPAGYVAVPDATVTMSGSSAAATTDSDGCFSMEIESNVNPSSGSSLGTVIFSATKTNASGGTTTLKKAANVTAGSTVQLINDDCISLSTTVAAMIVEQKISDGETDVAPDEIEEYVATIEDQEDIQALYTAILTSAEADEEGLDAISETIIANAEIVTDKPAIWDASVAGSPVAAAGGAVTITAKAAAPGDGNSIASVSATLTPASGTPISVALAADQTNASLYTGSYTFSANTSADSIVYSVAIGATDANSATNTYATDSLAVTVSGTDPVCGNGVQETGEACDDGNTTTETCAYGQTSCTVCDAACQSVAGVATYCGDGAQQANETCDDGNAATEICAYGQTSCSVCNASCQTAAGAVSACGDGATDATNSETCDDGNTATETCAYGDTSCMVCNATCQSVAGTTSYCGDGATDATNSEICDDGNATTETCAYGDTSCTVCSATCQSVAGTTSYCGDGTTDAANSETCDDGNTISYDGCSSSCQTDIPYSIMLGIGSTFACTVTNTGQALCWGNNADGALGNGDTANSSVPVQVSGLSSGVRAISAHAGSHSCALTDAGGVKCWGFNTRGQLGDGTTTMSRVPVSVTGLDSGVSAIFTGEYTTCAILETGAAQCWGQGWDGELGNGSTSNSSLPVSVTGLASGASSISGGSMHTCALLDTGGVQCWGSNNNGQLGDGSIYARSLVPVSVSGLSSGVSAITTGANCSCALLDTGAVKCWGKNDYGQLGDGSTSNSSVPVSVSGLNAGVVAITGGRYHTCALLDTGAAKCWGNNWDGQLGDGSTTESSVPVSVSGLSSGVAAIAAGGYFTCAIKDNGDIYCWGAGWAGQLGNNAFASSYTPVQVLMD